MYFSIEHFSQEGSLDFVIIIGKGSRPRVFLPLTSSLLLASIMAERDFLMFPFWMLNEILRSFRGLFMSAVCEAFIFSVGNGIP